MLFILNRAVLAATTVLLSLGTAQATGDEVSIEFTTELIGQQDAAQDN